MHLSIATSTPSLAAALAWTTGDRILSLAMPQVSALLASYLSTYLLHSSLLLMAVCIIDRIVRPSSPLVREWLWKAAATLGIFSAAALVAWPDARPLLTVRLPIEPGRQRGRSAATPPAPAQAAPQERQFPSAAQEPAASSDVSWPAGSRRQLPIRPKTDQAAPDRQAAVAVSGTGRMRWAAVPAASPRAAHRYGSEFASRRHGAAPSNDEPAGVQVPAWNPPSIAAAPRASAGRLRLAWPQPPAKRLASSPPSSRLPC